MSEIFILRDILSALSLILRLSLLLPSLLKLRLVLIRFGMTAAVIINLSPTLSQNTIEVTDIMQFPNASCCHSRRYLITLFTYIPYRKSNFCPDISLLSVLADYFEISIDELMGHDTPIKRERLQDDTKDNLTEKALILLEQNGKLSTYLLQLHLSIGYNKAKLLLENLESEGYLVHDGAHTYVAKNKK